MVRISIIAGAMLIVGGTIAMAQEASTDFTFRRVKAPEPQSTARRITVQIDPAERIAVPPPAPGPKPGAQDVAGAAAWFWQAISPDLAAASPARLDKALRHLANAPEGRDVPAPRLRLMQRIAGAHGRDILRATVGTNVSPALVLAVITVESSGRPRVESSAGAVGLMQLMPATAARFGVKDRTDPVQNIKGGVAFLDLLVQMFDGDPMLVLAGYNAGENAVLGRQGVPPYAETRNYVPRVLAAWQVASALCLTPPGFISDGCVFAGPGAASGN